MLKSTSASRSSLKTWKAAPAPLAGRPSLRPAPDGYTLGFINLPNFNATISEGLATYTVDSFAPICNHVTETSVVLVKADSQFNTLEDLVKFAKDNPGKLKASTNGNRASNHIGAQVLATSAGFEYTDIPYGGTADQLLALRQGEVDFSVAKVADFASFTSEVKVLARLQSGASGGLSRRAYHGRTGLL